MIQNISLVTICWQNSNKIKETNLLVLNIMKRMCTTWECTLNTQKSIKTQGKVLQQSQYNSTILGIKKVRICRYVIIMSKSMSSNVRYFGAVLFLSLYRINSNVVDKRAHDN